MRIEALAKIVHEANRAYCESIGEYTQLPWEATRDNIKASAVDGILHVMKNPDAAPSASHDNWLAFKAADGWVFGEIKDEVLKTHPCMVAYSDLPEEQRVKDDLFQGIVLALMDTVEYDESPAGEVVLP